MALIASSVKLVSHGMRLVDADQTHLPAFIESLSDENVRELREFYKIEPEWAINDLDLSDGISVVIYKGVPVCLTGIQSDGKMWAMFSKELEKNKLRFVRASMALIEYYHGTHDQLQCSVWIKNGKTLQWLAFLGFEPVGVQKNHNGDEYVVFVRCASCSERNRPKELRPVMH